jgi:hypothetical protein
VLKRVDAKIDVEGTEPQPVYDFAILNDRLLIVTHHVSEASVIDVASGKESKPRYRVDGYLSWRKSDLEFYRELFEELAEKSTAMPVALPLVALTDVAVPNSSDKKSIRELSPS